MKRYLLSFLILISAGFSFGQSNEWTTAELEVLEKHGLEKTDHRGVVFEFDSTTDCDIQFSSLKEAIHYYLSLEIKKDLFQICIEDVTDVHGIDNQPLDIHAIVSLYLKTNQ